MNIIRTLMWSASFVLASCTANACHAAETKSTISLQSQERFEQAIRDRSTSPFFVKYTVVDDRTGMSITRCGLAPLLLGAVHIEKGLPYDNEARAKVLQIVSGNSDHIFHFSKPEALYNLGPFGAKHQSACDIIDHGQSARRADLTGQILALP